MYSYGRQCFKKECFAYQLGECTRLTDTNFGGRECPFFKDCVQLQKEKQYTEARLCKIYGIEAAKKFAYIG